MYNLIIGLIRLPWWGYLFVSALCFGLTFVTVNHHTQSEAAKAQALIDGPPPVVDLADFNRADHKTSLGEVHISGRIDHNYDYELELIDRGSSSFRYTYFLFGEHESAEARAVRAVLFLTPSEEEVFQQNMESFVQGFNLGHFTYAFNGKAASAGDFSSMISEVIQDEGLTKASNFVVIKPYLSGRDSAFAPSDDSITPVAKGLAGLCLLAGLFKFVFFRGPKRKSPSARGGFGGAGVGRGGASSNVSATTAPAAAAPSGPVAYSAGGPLDRIRQREAQRLAERDGASLPHEEPQPAAFYSKPKPAQAVIGAPVDETPETDAQSGTWGGVPRKHVLAALGVVVVLLTLRLGSDIAIMVGPLLMTGVFIYGAVRLARRVAGVFGGAKTAVLGSVQKSASKSTEPHAVPETSEISTRRIGFVRPSLSSKPIADTGPILSQKRLGRDPFERLRQDVERYGG